MKNLKLQKEIFAPMDGNYTFPHRTALSEVTPASSVAIISAEDGKHFINADVNGFVTVLVEDGVHKKDEKIAEVYVKKEAGDIKSFSELAEFLCDYIDSKYEERDSKIRDIFNKLYDIEQMLENSDDDWDDDEDENGNDDFMKLRKLVSTPARLNKEAVCPVCKTTVPAGTRCCPNCGMICGGDTRKN